MENRIHIIIISLIALNIILTGFVLKGMVKVGLNQSEAISVDKLKKIQEKGLNIKTVDFKPIDSGSCASLPTNPDFFNGKCSQDDLQFYAVSAAATICSTRRDDRTACDGNSACVKTRTDSRRGSLSSKSGVINNVATCCPNDPSAVNIANQALEALLKQCP